MLATVFSRFSYESHKQRLGPSPRLIWRAVENEVLNAGNTCAVLAQRLPAQQLRVDVGVVRVKRARWLVRKESEGEGVGCTFSESERMGEKRGGEGHT